MSNKFMLLLAAMTAVYASGAGAESTSESLTRIEAETLVLKAREKQLEVQSSIVSKQNEIAVKQSMTTAINQPVVVGDPVIRAIEGIGSKMYATLQMNDGSIVDVQQGDVLPNGMKIVAISSREVVVLSKNNERIRLASYAPQNNSFNPSFPSVGLSFPPQIRSVAR